jgi:hypothetical protein
VHVTPLGLLTRQVPPASAHEGNVSDGEKQVVVHVPPRQHGPKEDAHGHAPPRVPDPSGVLPMSSLNAATAPTLMAEPPQRQLDVQ